MVMAALIKANDNVPPGQLVFFRSCFAIMPIVIFLAYRGELIEGLKTKRPFGHLWRGLIGVAGLSFNFIALTKLPLPESTAINYTMPLLIIVFSAVFFHEKIRLYRWSAVLIGFVGVAIILWPRLSVFVDGGTMTDASLGAVAALLSSICGACAMLMIRALVLTERSATIALYFSLTCTLLSCLTIPFGWAALDPGQTATLVAAGIAGGIAQVLMTESYRHAEVSVVAPFEYTSLLLSIGIGFVFFHDIPTINMLFGAVLMIGAGIFIIYRERQLGLERRRAAEASGPPN